MSGRKVRIIDKGGKEIFVNVYESLDVPEFLKLCRILGFEAMYWQSVEPIISSVHAFSDDGACSTTAHELRILDTGSHEINVRLRSLRDVPEALKLCQTLGFDVEKWSGADPEGGETYGLYRT